MFSQIDLFGRPVILNFNGKDRSKSNVGAWFTVLFAAFLIWAITQLGKDLTDRKNPKTIMSEYFEENPSPMYISPDTFNVAFGLQHPTTYAHYIDNSIYTVEVTRDKMVRTVKEDGTVDIQYLSTPLVTETCTKEHFGPSASKFETIELNQLYCLKTNQPELENIEIQGVFESPLFEYVSITFKQCDNTTSGMSCAPREKLNELLDGAWFATYFTNLAIEPRNYSYPNVGYRDSFYTSMSNNYFKEIALWLAHVEVATDSGWLTKDTKTDNYIKLDHTSEYTSFVPNGQMIHFVLRVDKIVKHYERSYIKVQEVLAQTNGFASAGLIVLAIILLHYSRLKFHERLINELFEIKTFKQKTNNKGNTKKRSKKAQPCIVIDGDFDKTSENKKAAEEKMLENNIVKPSWPSVFSNADKGKNSSSSPKVVVDDQKFKNSKILSPREGENVAQKKLYSSSNIDVKSIKIELSSQNNEKDKKLEGKKFSDNKYASVSNFCPFSSQLLKDKPIMSDQPKSKILENFEIQSPGTSFLADANIEKDPVSKNDLPDGKLEAKNETYGINISKPDRQIDSDNNDEKIEQRAEKIPKQIKPESFKIDIKFSEYLQSFFWKSESLKEKVGLLDEGVRRIRERLNIFNLLKKLREIDKLKLLLLENHQYVLFEALPNPELSIRSQLAFAKEDTATNDRLRDSKFIAERRKYELIQESYIELKKKREPTIIDKRLLEIYDTIIDS